MADEDTTNEGEAPESNEVSETPETPDESPEAPEESDALDEFDASDGEVEGTSDIDFILDIPLELSVELGRSKMLVIDLLGLSQGSIVELDKLAGEPLEIFINRKLVARGEVVVVNEKFGVRLTDIITPIERVRSLSGS